MDELSLVPRPQRLELGQNRTRWLHLEPKDASAHEITHLLDSTDDEGERRRLTVCEDPNRAVGGYSLKLQSDSVVVSAAGQPGIIAVASTLRQLELLTRRDPELRENFPELLIEDAPRFEWRGLHLDVSRHFFPKATVEKMIDLCHLHKLNRFHWHLTDDHGWRLESERYPKLTDIGAWRGDPAYGGFYTKPEVREVIEYARVRGVMVVPEIDIPGHCRAALAAYPELSCHGGPFVLPEEALSTEDAFCVGRDTTIQFLETIFDELIDLFPSPWIHLGADECPLEGWSRCPHCQERRRSLGLDSDRALESWVVSQVARVIASRGRTVVGWDEIVEGDLPAGAVVMSWRGEQGGIDAVRRGHDAVMTPTSHCYFDYKQKDDPDELGRLGVIPLERIVDYDPLPSALTPIEVPRILGTQANVWTEGIKTPQELEYMVIPRICALSEAAWTQPQRRDSHSLRTRLAKHVESLAELGYEYRPLSS